MLGRTAPALTVVKWMGFTPEIGSCVACGKMFIVPLSAIKTTEDAESNLKRQFDLHICTKKSES